MHFSDIDFIHGIKNKDEKILKALYHQYYRMIRHFILSNNGNEDDFKDNYHETLLVAIRAIQKEDFSLTSSLSTFIYSISRRIWLKQLNKNKPFNNVGDLYQQAFQNSDDDIEKIVEEHQIKEKNINKIQIALQHIGDNCYQILKLFYYERLSMETIAEKLGYNNSDVAKNQKYKCLQKLKKVFFENNISDTVIKS